MHLFIVFIFLHKFFKILLESHSYIYVKVMPTRIASTECYLETVATISLQAVEQGTGLITVSKYSMMQQTPNSYFKKYSFLNTKNLKSIQTLLLLQTLVSIYVYPLVAWWAIPRNQKKTAFWSCIDGPRVYRWIVFGFTGAKTYCLQHRSFFTQVLFLLVGVVLLAGFKVH